MGQTLMYLVPVFGILALLYTMWKSAWVNRQDAGTDKMKGIGKAIEDGAMAFLKAEYKVGWDDHPEEGTICLPDTIKLTKILSQRYIKRNGGYSRVIRAGYRYGDDAPMAVIELVDRDLTAKKVDVKIKKKPKEAAIDQKSLDTKKESKPKK